MSNDEILESVIDAGFVAKVDGGNVSVDLNASKASSGASDIGEALSNLQDWCKGQGLTGTQSGDTFTISA